ncbi:hypothetical protein ACM66B_004210 [Microbotryomycetes sp. NB124-2]
MASAWAAVTDAARAVGDILWQPVHNGAIRVIRAARDTVGTREQAHLNAIGDVAPTAAGINRNPTNLVEPPSALSFLTSSYFCLIVALSVISNRIHAVVPPRRALNHTPSPTVCRVLRLPSLLLLARTVFLLTVTILVARGYNPMHWTSVPTLARTLTWLTTWAGKSSLPQIEKTGIAAVKADQICWETFLAVALAALTENFMRALLDDLHAPEFNLLGFSFLLHVGSAVGSSAPNAPQPVDLYLHLLIVTAEMLHLHTSYALTPPLPPLRLVISGFWSLTSQAVAVRGLVRLWRGDNLDSRVAWQSMLWSTAVPQLLMMVMAGLTITLRFLTAVLRKEEVSVSSIFGHEAHFPRASDDFAIAVVRYGGACLAQTRLAGLANEVSPLRILAPAPLALVGLRLPPAETEREPAPYIELGRGADLTIKWRGSLDGRVPLGRDRGGLGTEIKDVETVERWGGPPSTRERRQGREVWRVVQQVLQIVFYVVYRACQVIRTCSASLKRRLGLSRDEEVIAASWRTNEDAEDADDVDWIPRDGDTLSDNEDTSDETSSDGASNMVAAESDSDDDDDFDAAMLLRDLREDESASSLTPVLVAHHLSGSPLTRRQFRLLSTAPASSQAFASALEERQLELRHRAQERGLPTGWEDERRREIDEGRQRFCVVCAVEERTVVLWPCRCLTLCDDCRSNLAERTPASQHLCPTCRAPVKGFSKLYIP